MVGMRPGGGSIRTAAVGRGHDYTRARRDRPARRARERRVLPAAPLVAEGIEGEGEDPAGEGHPGDLGAPAIRDRVGEVLHQLLEEPLPRVKGGTRSLVIAGATFQHDGFIVPRGRLFSGGKGVD